MLSKGARTFDTSAAGRWIFVKIPGVTLQWDKGTTVIVRVEQHLQSQLEGLCGEYDGNVKDDLVTRGGIATADVLAFGDSWSADESCPAAITVIDPCDTNNHRKPWATKTCSILTDDAGVFAACHQHVDPEKYFKNCVFDACACDSGADCACLCTAIAAYTHECNRFGVHVNWRSNHLCPMQCDGCAGYSPCHSC